MNIAICDDEKECIDTLKLQINEYMENHYIKANFYVTTSPKEILNSDVSFDLAFLDIEMPEVDGITVAKKLKERNRKVILFFVTAFDEYQDEAMNLNIFRFFEKPFDKRRLYSGLDKAMEYIDNSFVDIYCKTGGASKRVLVDDIVVIKRENRKVTIITTDGEYQVQQSFDELICEVKASFFYLVHKSFYINLHYVDEYNYDNVIMQGKTKISVSSNKRTAFRKYWFEYLRRR